MTLTILPPTEPLIPTASSADVPTGARAAEVSRTDHGCIRGIAYTNSSHSVCVHMCRCTCVRVYVSVYMCLCTCVCVHVSVYVCMCTCVCVYARIYVCCVQVPMYVYICVHQCGIYVCIECQMWLYMCTMMRSRCTYVCVCKCLHTSFVCVHIHICTHAVGRQWFVCVCVCVCT